MLLVELFVPLIYRGNAKIALGFDRTPVNVFLLFNFDLATTCHCQIIAEAQDDVALGVFVFLKFVCYLLRFDREQFQKNRLNLIYHYRLAMSGQGLARLG